MPQQQNGEQPPPYGEAVAGHDQEIINQQNQGVPVGYYQQNQVIRYNQNQPVIDGQATVAVVQISQSARNQYNDEGKQNATNSVKGFFRCIV